VNPDLTPLARHASLFDGQRPERLAEVHERIGLARKRRRRSALGAVATAATVLVVAAVVTGVADQRADEPPPVAPSPSVSESTPDQATRSFPVLSPEEIRGHPDAEVSSGGDFPATASAVAARIWSVCLDDCSRATEHLAGEQQTALEVSHDDFATGALYRLDSSENISHAIDDWYLVDARGGAKLVDSRGHRRPLEPSTSVPITDIAGPLVYSRSGLAYVDMQGRQLHVIGGQGEAANWEWGGAGDTWFWGAAAFFAEDTTVTRQAAVWRNPDGTFAAKVLPIGDSDGGPGMLAARTPGTMAVVEHFAHPRVAHISTDYGRTWQAREVPSAVDSGGRLPSDWTSWPTP
jgi:hypothetical protein